MTMIEVVDMDFDIRIYPNFCNDTDLAIANICF